MILTPHWSVSRLAIAAMCATAVVAQSVASSGAAGDVIHIWVVGSPHSDAVPEAPSALRLAEEAKRRGYDVSVDAFPARGFAATFAEAVVRNAAPDVLVFDNFGVMDGITTRLGRFDGIAQDPITRTRFIKVTRAFDELLASGRGWTYLFTPSRNHAAARTLALRAPDCRTGSTPVTVQGELGRIIPSVATAYLKGDIISLQALSDPDRLPGVQLNRSALNVGGMEVCGVWGNDKLAFVLVTAAYEAEDALGNAHVLLVFRKLVGQWRLLVVTRDPIATGEFVSDIPRLVRRFAQNAQSGALPIPAVLLSPTAGRYPARRDGQRFGAFNWRASPSSDVIGEIGEFAYYDDERLFLAPSAQPASRSEISAGRLWSTRREWFWRIWSVSPSGDLNFSESRTFVH